MLRRLLLLFGIAGLVALAAPAGAQSIFTTAPFAILIDAESGGILFEKNADNQMSPASMVKVMTAELVFREIREGRLSLDDTMVISQNAWRRGGAPAGGSTMFAQVNSSVRVEDLLRGVIIQSGNDASIALAEGLLGTDEAFAQKMTARGREIGMTSSTFRNSWGAFHPQQKTTARDLARLAAHVIRTYPEFYKYFGETEFTWNKIRQLNRNPLLTMNIGADGLKTGQVEDSGFGLIGSATDGASRVIVVVNGLKSGRDRAEEARKLLTWGLRAFERRALFARNETVGSAPIYGGASSRVPLLADGPVQALVPRGSNERLTGRIVYLGPIMAPVRAGDQIARLHVFRGKTLALDVPLRAAQDVEQGSLPRRAFDAGIELMSGLFRKYVFGS
jgi:serine-type D-Ala-D-Ala carboxypeptidase (penicillin-binding protein 5/6)